MPDCMHCLENTRHPLWVYMLSTRPVDVVETEKISDYLTYIGVSRHPLHRLNSHNRVKGFKVGSKITKAGSPHWNVEITIGPFYSGGAYACKMSWRDGYRKLIRRLTGGVKLASQCGLNMYFRDEATKEMVLELIKLDH